MGLAMPCSSCHHDLQCVSSPWWIHKRTMADSLDYPVGRKGKPLINFQEYWSVTRAILQEQFLIILFVLQQWFVFMRQSSILHLVTSSLKRGKMRSSEKWNKVAREEPNSPIPPGGHLCCAEVPGAETPAPKFCPPNRGCVFALIWICTRPVQEGIALAGMWLYS